MDPMEDANMKAQQGQEMAQQAQQPEQDIARCAADAIGGAGAQSSPVPFTVPLRMRLEREFNSNASRQRVVAQALDIITRHPEFEEFLLLQRIVNHIY